MSDEDCNGVDSSNDDSNERGYNIWLSAAVFFFGYVEMTENIPESILYFIGVWQ